MSNTIIIDECNVNFVHLVGRVVSDVKLSETNEKKIPVLNFRLLTKRFVGSTKKVVTQIHRIVCWSDLAKDVAQRIRKNMTVEVFGELVSRKYKTQDTESGEPIVIALSEVKAFRVTPFKGRIRRVIEVEESNENNEKESKTKEESK